MIFVFIGGASASGKTGLSRHLLSKLNDSGMSAQMLNMDDYFHERPEEEDPEQFRINTNFDTPKMLHFDLLAEHLEALHKGNPITKPLFVFQSNRREGKELIHPSKVIIIEGIFAQYFSKNFLPSALASVTVNVATDNYLDIVERRIKRDIEQRQRVRSEVEKQEQKFVGPGFLKYTASSSMGADVYVLNEHKEGNDEQNRILNAAADEVILEIKKKMAEMKTGSLEPSRPAPNVQEMVARSHLIAGTLFNPRRFEGHFSGVFGNYEGTFVRDFTEEEFDEATTDVPNVF